jgi:hypothetical protein
MATVTADAFVSTARERRSLAVSPTLAVGAIASIGAGAIHAAAIGVHSEHRQAVITFTIVAAVQLAWGVLALLYANRWLALAGAAANTAAFVGWVMAKTSGIGFIDGLDVAEKAQFADFAAAMLAAVAVIGAVAFAVTGMRASSLGRPALALGAVITTAITVPAMVAAGSHSHAGAGHTHGGEATAVHTHGAGSGATAGHSHAAAIPPKPYDPTKPIDLGGVPGVSLEQQARAENLIAITLLRLPQWNDYKYAESQGFSSIGDGVTGHEHFINTTFFDDGRILDPDHPESLVYEPQPDGSKKLVSAMYMLAPNQTLDDVPDVGGKLTQWHIHNNLCFTTDGRVGGLTNGAGGCNAPLVKGPEMPMIHVWIQPHPCGPFAALEGIGGGQIKEGEARLCDHAHGSSGA